MLEHNLAALELVHVQDLVDQLEQHLSRLADLATAVVASGQVVLAALGDVEHAHDAVERRADVVAHAQQKVGLCPVGALGLLFGGQQAALIGLLALAALALQGQVLLDDRVDELEAHQDVARIVHLDHVELVVVHHAAVQAAVGARVLGLAAGQNQANVVGAQLQAHAVLVFGVHAAVQPKVQHGLVGKDLVAQVNDGLEVVVVGHLQDLGGAVHDVCQVDVAVVARKDVKDGQLLLQFTLVGLVLLALLLLVVHVAAYYVVDVLETGHDVLLVARRA